MKTPIQFIFLALCVIFLSSCTYVSAYSRFYVTRETGEARSARILQRGNNCTSQLEVTENIDARVDDLRNQNYIVIDYSNFSFGGVVKPSRALACAEHIAADIVVVTWKLNRIEHRIGYRTIKGPPQRVEFDQEGIIRDNYGNRAIYEGTATGWVAGPSTTISYPYDVRIYDHTAVFLVKP